MFLSDLGDREGLKTASFAARFPGSSTLWAEYLNGSKVIPAHVLGQVVQELCGTDRRLLGPTLVRARTLQKEAAAEASRPPTAAAEPQVAARELINVQQRLVESHERLNKATEFAEGARATITTLLGMYARAENSVRELTTQRDRNHALKRSETEARLNQARLRLERTEAELERARQHRYTAEQAQKALIIEAEEARRELEELRRSAADLSHGTGSVDGPEPPPLPARREVTGPDADEDFADFDDALERITSESEDRERDLIDLAEHTGTPAPEQPTSGPQIITGTVVPTPGPAPEARTPDGAPPDDGAESTSGRPSESAVGMARATGVDAPDRSPAPRTGSVRPPSRPSDPSAPEGRSAASSPPHSPPQVVRPRSASIGATSPGLSGTTPEKPSTSENSSPKGPLAADRIYLDPADTYEAAFVRDLEALLRKTKLPFGKLKELAPNEVQLSILLRGRVPSLSFVEEVIRHVAHDDLTTWQELWTTTDRTPKAQRPPQTEASPLPPGGPGKTDSVSALLWAWVCGVLIVVLAYTFTATISAGMQADPGAGIVNLVVYTVVGLPALVVVALIMTGSVLVRPESEVPFGSCFVGFCLALPAGLIVPWCGAVNQPWHWVADHLGVI
ncbi:hypothetical protein [Streptomyces sp. DT171]|uniref:hypothetical protein n=1 Tax=Streptomyces sp. DT171 TaxID=3416524 RepID=UPI003CEA9863